MKLTLYVAISIDGLISKGSDDTEWVSKTDWAQFYKYIKSSDAVIMGRRTMDQFDANDFPIKGPTNIVLTNNPLLRKETKNLIIMSGTPLDVVSKAKAKGFKKLLLIGGAQTNREFIKANLIDEIVVSMHPLAIGNGLQLFGSEPLDVKLKPISTKLIKNELVQIVYKVIK
jgi:dihydrofolate reductase